MKPTLGLRVALVDIDKSYQAPDRSLIPVLEGLTLHVGPGELACISGRSGSGKTTVLSICGLLLSPDRGRRLIGGSDLTAITAEEGARFRREHIGFCFQEFLLVPTLTALENVLLPLVPDGVTGDDVELARRKLADLGLADRADHLPAHLSGGEQQRVALARALLRDPGLLLVDEPTANLDRRSARDIAALLRDARDTRLRTIVVASHDASLVTLADRVIELEGASNHQERTRSRCGDR